MPKLHLLVASALATASALSCALERPALSLDEAVDALSTDTFVTHMTALSSDAMAGRRPGTAGYDSAAAYIVRAARDLGLEPGGVAATFMQPIDFRRATLDEGSARFSVAGVPLAYGSDYVIDPRTTRASLDLMAPLVFAGFGISAPDLGHDDFEGIDVAGKLVVVVAGAPTGFGSLERTVLSSRASRDAELRERGARGVIVVQSDDLAGAVRPRVRYLVPTDAGRSDRPEELEASLSVSRQVAAEWLSRAGRSFDQVLEGLHAGRPASFDLELDARVQATFEHEAFASANIAALWPGSDPQLSDEVLVLTAHLDHLGVGPVIEGDSIYNGTLDNASGSAALLTLASVLTRLEAPRRSVLLLWVTAEESGLLGSEYFARFPTLGSRRIVANQNIDGVMGMITAATDVLAFGYEHSNLSESVDYAVTRTGTPVAPDPTPEENLFIRSDQYAFVRQGIPAIWVQGGRTALDPDRDAQGELDAWIVERYHKPSDDLAQPLDLEGIRRELHNNLLVTWHALNALETIEWHPESFLYQRWVRD